MYECVRVREKFCTLSNWMPVFRYNVTECKNQWENSCASLHIRIHLHKGNYGKVNGMRGMRWQRSNFNCDTSENFVCKLKFNVQKKNTTNDKKIFSLYYKINQHRLKCKQAKPTFTLMLSYSLCLAQSLPFRCVLFPFHNLFIVSCMFNWIWNGAHKVFSSFHWGYFSWGILLLIIAFEFFMLMWRTIIHHQVLVLGSCSFSYLHSFSLYLSRLRMAMSDEIDTGLSVEEPNNGSDKDRVGWIWVNGDEMTSTQAI